MLNSATLTLLINEKRIIFDKPDKRHFNVTRQVAGSGIERERERGGGIKILITMSMVFDVTIGNNLQYLQHLIHLRRSFL